MTCQVHPVLVKRVQYTEDKSFFSGYIKVLLFPTCFCRFCSIMELPDFTHAVSRTKQRGDRTDQWYPIISRNHTYIHCRYWSNYFKSSEKHITVLVKSFVHLNVNTRPSSKLAPLTQVGHTKSMTLSMKLMCETFDLHCKL